MFIEKSVPHPSSVPTNAKRAFGVDLDECHTCIHIVDLWVERSES